MADMLTNDEIRRHLGRADMPDKEANALRKDLYGTRPANHACTQRGVERVAAR